MLLYLSRLLPPTLQLLGQGVQTSLLLLTCSMLSLWLIPPDALPIGPIGAAGDLAIDAALHPADGPWFYFVPVNLDTGETVFSVTLAEHNAAVRQLQEWCRATKSPNCD